MKFIILLAVLLVPLISLHASESPLCSSLKISLTGHYGERGENAAELLDKWSEQSGDLVSLEISGKQNFSAVELQFIDDNKNEIKKIKLPLSKNKTAVFQFIKMLTDSKPRASEVNFTLIQSKDKKHCHETVEIFKGQEMGATEVKHGKK